MQKAIAIIVAIFLLNNTASGQKAAELISAVHKSQQSVKGLYYKMVRSDTLVTGDIRTITGSVVMQADTSDPVFGFLFWAKEDGSSSQMIYNGKMLFETDDKRMSYAISTNQSGMPEILYHSGGRIVVPDLIKLDTASATGIMVNEDNDHYYLTISYANLTMHDVINRYKKVVIDKANMLPSSVRKHQETLGKIQDLTWNVQMLSRNDSLSSYNFDQPEFVKTHTLKIPMVTVGHRLATLKDKPAPSFTLKSFNDQMVSSKEMIGKVVLLDFWEVWCGPCIESMPKVQQLYEMYKDKGLLVYGIINDTRQLEPSRKLMSRKPEIQFPMLTGNQELKKNYLVHDIPEYVLIDRSGRIVYLSLGYNQELEREIEKALIQD